MALTLSLLLASVALWRAMKAFDDESCDRAWLWSGISAACVLPVALQNTAAAGLSLLAATSFISIYLVLEAVGQQRSTTMHSADDAAAANRTRVARRRKRRSRREVKRANG